MKAGFISLGCSKNLVDTEVMLGILKQHGIELTANPAEADILIVNTCAFIQSAKEESITTILNMAEYKESGRCRSLIVAGCLGQRYKQELLDEIPEADAIIGTGAWGRIMEAVEETLKGHRVVIAGKDEALYDENTPRITTTPSYTAYIKIAEGCNNRCAFCAIPYIRGDYRSRRIEDICDEVRHLTENGVREVVLIAQDSTEYGRDLYGAPKLSELLREIVKVPKLQWVRTLYSYPKYFSDELIETIASEPKICKYVDLPLQHAHDAVLRSMRRPDTQEEMRALIKKLRERIPGVTIRSTFIVGFPGETDAQYHTLRNFIEEMRLDKVGVFTYSREEGTPAYDMPNQVPEEIMQERYHDLMSLQCKISEQINQSLEGKELDVLVEGRDEEQPNISVGRSYREAPEVDGQVYVENDTDSKPGDIVHVRVRRRAHQPWRCQRSREEGSGMSKKLLEEQVGQQLLAQGLTIACAESCTGGLLTSRLTDIAGSSAYVMGSVVSYTNRIKETLVGVQHETLLAHGAVSEETAREMAEGIRRAIETDIGVGITGIAGPGGGTKEKPVGLVFIAVSGPRGTMVKENHFSGTRTEVKRQTTDTALAMASTYLTQLNHPEQNAHPERK